MIDDLAAYGPGAEFEADLCVVGAGAAGLAIARELLGSRTRVLLVESGGTAPDAGTDLLKEGEADGLRDTSLVEGRARGLGGSTTVWAGQCIPLDELDFEEREWVPHSGWPISAADLGPYYERAASLLGVPGETYDGSLWSRWGIAPPPLDDAKVRHTYTAWAPHPDLGRSLAAELRRSRSVRVLLHANVTSIETDAARTAFSHLTLRHLDGTVACVRARACVLCAGGIENARLLLASGEPEEGGLGNVHGNVGRYFQDHPNARCAVLRTREPRKLQEPYSLLYRRRRRYLPKLALAPALQHSERVLNCGANLEYEFADEGLNALRRIYRASRAGTRSADVRRDARLAARGLSAAAVSAYRRFARGRSPLSPPATIWLQVHCEQAPDPDSRVTLSRERDALGSSRARVEWRLTDLELRTVETMAEVVASEFRRLGLAEAEPADLHFNDSYHHMGTTRMADDPARGVVDRDCRVHGVAGLYVAGSSVFPTGGFANPTLTIVALSLRLADHVRSGL
jgi:choline dehydrogenase-like flavoprotein